MVTVGVGTRGTLRSNTTFGFDWKLKAALTHVHWFAAIRCRTLFALPVLSKTQRPLGVFAGPFSAWFGKPTGQLTPFPGVP